jgi:Domain of unknown function (DUF5664)/Domain of unknown function (DUF1937)
MRQVHDLSELHLNEGYWYIATPYTKFAGGLDEAYCQARDCTVAIRAAGVTCFCPILHGHEICMFADVSKTDYDIWIPFNRQWIDRAHGMVIVQMEGWQDSFGVAEEIKLFVAAGKPIFLLDPVLLGIGPLEPDLSTCPGSDFPYLKRYPLDEPFPEYQAIDNPKQHAGVQKVGFSHVPLTVIAEVAVGMMEGSMKYGRHNYRAAGSIIGSTYYDATRRHLDAWFEGEDIDAPSGLSHITKAIASLVVLRDAMIQGRFKDDRPPKAPAGWMDSLNSAVRQLNEKYPEPAGAFTED